MYIGFSNDTVLYKKSIDEFILKAESITNLSISQIEEVNLTPSSHSLINLKLFLPDDLLRNFAKLGEKAFEKLSEIIFVDFKKQFHQGFMDLKMVKTKYVETSINSFRTICSREYLII